MALFWRKNRVEPVTAKVAPPVSIGLALGGGFTRGMAHIGILQVLEEEGIPVDYIAGVSAGAIVAAAYASGTTPEEIARVGSALHFGDVARWTFCKLGICCTDGMTKLLARLLKHTRFEEMRIPLAIAATDLETGEPVIFSESGDVRVPIHASCAFPGIYQPVSWNGRVLTDGGVGMEVPSELVRNMGATRVISAWIPFDSHTAPPANMIEVVSRSLQILQMRTAYSWRSHSDLIIAPELHNLSWLDFGSSRKIIAAGAEAARRSLPAIREWMDVKAAA